MICLLRRFHNAWEFWVYSVVYGLVVGPNYSISQTMMGELTPPGFEYMVGVSLWSQLSASYSYYAVFRFIWTLQSLRINSWTECDPSDSRQKRKQLEGLPSSVCSQCPWMSCGVVRHKHAERKACGSAVDRGEASDGCRHNTFAREESWGFLRLLGLVKERSQE